MKIRPARKEEVGIVLQLIHDLAHYEKAPNEVEATEKELLATIFIDNPKVFCDVVDVDGEIVGMAIWFLNYSTWQGKHGIYLEDLFIKPEYRRFQWWVLDWNSPAIEFYRSLGAVAMDEWTVYRVSGNALKELGK
jgi:GNAT superfamily N-acetyltransferase